MNGAELISQERKRQIESEGWDESHDDLHTAGQLASAASMYIQYGDHPRWQRGADWQTDTGGAPAGWPWESEWWKPTGCGRLGRIRAMVKAGALLAAEIDRLQREQENDEPPDEEPIVVTVMAKQLLANGVWDEVCRIKGINEYVIAEGLMQSTEMIGFTESEVKQLAAIGAFTR